VSVGVVTATAQVPLGKQDRLLTRFNAEVRMSTLIHHAVVQHWISKTHTGGDGMQGTPSCAAPEGSAGIARACTESPVQTAAVPQGAAAEAPAQAEERAQSWRVARLPHRLYCTLQRLGVVHVLQALQALPTCQGGKRDCSF
jgi:hypothetical protein